MNPNQCFAIVVCLFLTINLNAQTEITGFVKNLNNLPIEGANVVIYDSDHDILAYDYTQTDGAYLIRFNPNTSAYIVLSAQSLGYQKKSDTLRLEVNKNKYIISFNLEEKIEELNEIILNPDEKISREGNTTTFKVSAFKNDTEQTVEDILKNIPGVEVLKDGTIKAHGRFIDKLLIEGEDMFDKNYTILSKNLDAKVLDAVQILEDFEDNPILAKVIESDKVAINLVLKEDYKNIWFGNISLGLGSEERLRAASNLGLIRKKIKFFNFNDYNNLGKKASEQLETAPISATNNNSFREQTIEPKINSIYSIQDNESDIFKEGQSTFNKAFIDALSFVSNLNSDVKIRGTGYFTSDNQNQLFSSETIFNTDETPIIYSESNNTTFKNSVAGGEVELKYTGGEKSYLKNVLVYDNKPQKATNNALFNDNEIRQYLKQDEYSLYNHLNHSLLLGNKNILHTYLYFGENEIKQKSDINSPVLNNLFAQPENATTNHFSHDKSSVFGGKSTVIVNFQKLQNNIEIGFESLKELRNNNLVLSDYENNINIDSLINNFTFKQKKIHLKTNSKYSLSKKVELSAGLSIDNIDINSGISKSNKWLLNPRVGLRLQNLKIGYFSLSYSRNYNEPKSNLFLPNYQLSSYQSFIKGQKDIYFSRNNIYSFFYQISNNMQTKMLSVRTQYISSDGRYSTETQIGQNLILNSYNFVDSGNILSSNINFTSYFKKLNVSTSLGSNQSWSNNPIKANTSEFKNLSSHISSYFLSGTTYLKLPINFTFKFDLKKIKSDFNNIESSTQWKTFDINAIYKLSDIWIASLNNNFYMMADSDYYFVDFKLNYTPKKSRFSYQFILNNLANQKMFSITDINEFSTFNSNIQLLPRYFYVFVKYRF